MINILFSGKDFVCRQCEHKTFLRIHRQWWMKIIPSSRLYRCDKCRDESLVLNGTLHIESTKHNLSSDG